MAEENDVDRNFPATPRRLEQARERGQVARSRELATAGVALAAAIGAASTGPALIRNALDVFRTGLAFDRDAAFSVERMGSMLSTLSVAALGALAPFLLLVLAATLAAPLALSGWVFSTQALVPDFNRLDPIAGIKRLFSSHGIVELVKALAKCALIGGIGAFVVMHDWSEMATLAAREPRDAASAVGSLGVTAFFLLAGGLVVIALIDAPYQFWRYRHELRMSREEIRQELREMEGDPQLKARVRSLQREAARKRMMAAVPTATVIVTNPTHYAVALEYREGEMRAPRVVAKGTELVAARIRELGAEHNVPTLEAPPLARALYRHVEIGQEIPQALYTVVAQLLAHVHQVARWRRDGGREPQAPAFDVPDGLDPKQGDA